MKTINYVIAAAMVGAMLSGCSKKDNNYNMASETIIPAAPKANVSVIVQTMRQKPGYMLQWNTGRITATQLQATGVHLIGNMLQATEYDQKVIRSIDILTPGIFTLGSVAVPYDLYDHMSFGLQLAPVGLTNSGRLDNSLYLSGSFYSVPPPDPMRPTASKNSFNPVPIQIIVNDAVVMNTAWLDKIRLSEPGYSATLFIDVNSITSGIDDVMLKNAVKTNGVIYITNISNQNLYGIILKNLENHLMEVRMSALLLNMSSNPIAANNHLQ